MAEIRLAGGAKASSEKHIGGARALFGQGIAPQPRRPGSPSTSHWRSSTDGGIHATIGSWRHPRSLPGNASAHCSSTYRQWVMLTRQWRKSRKKGPFAHSLRVHSTPTGQEFAGKTPQGSRRFRSSGIRERPGRTIAAQPGLLSVNRPNDRQITAQTRLPQRYLAWVSWNLAKVARMIFTSLRQFIVSMYSRSEDSLWRKASTLVS